MSRNLNNTATATATKSRKQSDRGASNRSNQTAYRSSAAFFAQTFDAAAGLVKSQIASDDEEGRGFSAGVLVATTTGQFPC